MKSYHYKLKVKSVLIYTQNLVELGLNEIKYINYAVDGVNIFKILLLH
jgi:hypothetical protein